MLDIEKIMALAGTNDDEDLDTQLDKVAQLYTQIINLIPEYKMDSYTWKVEFINEGESTKISKMNGDKEVAWITIDPNPIKTTFSDSSDEDLKKINAYIALGMLLGD